MTDPQPSPSRISRTAAAACVAAAVFTALLTSPGCARDNDDETIEFWTLALSPVFDDYVTSRIRLYESEHPGATVRWVDVPFDALDRKLIAAAAAGRAPDVVNFSDMTFARFAALGALVDLSPHLDEPTIGRYLPGARSIAEIDDGLLALPWYLTTQTLIINQPLLAAGGLDPEDLGTTWGELRARAQRFRRETGEYLFSAPLGRESILLQTMLSEGVVPFDTSDGRLVAAFDTEPVRDFLDEWVALFRADALPRESATGGFAHIIRLYQSRDIAVMNTSPNFLGRIRDEAPGVFKETAVRPAVTGALGRTHIATMVVGVTTQSDDPAEAARFAAWMTSPANQLAFCRLVNILPSTPASLEDPYFAPPPALPDAADDDARAIHLLAESRALAAASLVTAEAFTPALAAWPDLRRAFEDRFTSLLLDESDSVERACADIQSAWSSILAAAAPASMKAVPRPGPVSTEARAE